MSDVYEPDIMMIEPVLIWGMRPWRFRPYLALAKCLFLHNILQKNRHSEAHSNHV